MGRGSPALFELRSRHIRPYYLDAEPGQIDLLFDQAEAPPTARQPVRHRKRAGEGRPATDALSYHELAAAQPVETCR